MNHIPFQGDFQKRRKKRNTYSRRKKKHARRRMRVGTVEKKKKRGQKACTKEHVAFETRVRFHD